MIKIPGKIPITIHPIFWCVALVLAWISTSTIEGTIIYTGIIFISVLVHEYGHALTAVAFGQTAKIELVGFGGATLRQGGGRIRPWQDFIIVLNGPLAGFLLAIIAGWFNHLFIKARPDSFASEITLTILYVNIVWTVINLAPVHPLDGGKLLTILLEGIFGLRGKKISLFMSLLFATSAALFFISIQAFLPGALFFLFAYESYRSWRHTLSITEQDQNFILQHELKEAEYEFDSGRREEALKKFIRLRSLSRKGIIYQRASEHAAQLLADKGEIQKAHEILSTLGKRISPTGRRLLHRLAYQMGQWKEAIALGSASFRDEPDYNTALINAMCHGIQGEAHPCVGWIKCAMQQGLPDIHTALSVKEFDPIRNDPSFLQISQAK